MKRVLGLVILRGETVVSLSVEGPPPADAQEKPGVRPAHLLVVCSSNVGDPLQLQPGMGRGMPAGRGMGVMPGGASRHRISAEQHTDESLLQLLRPHLHEVAPSTSLLLALRVRGFRLLSFLFLLRRSTAPGAFPPGMPGMPGMPPPGFQPPPGFGRGM